MSLIVEYGAGVKGANTYVSELDLETYASENKLDFDGDESELLLLAMMYIEQLAFKGKKRTEYQRLQWPRLEVIIDRKSVSESSIPNILKNLQCEVAIEIANGCTQENDYMKISDEDYFVIDARPFAHNEKIKQLESKLTLVRGGGMVVRLF